MGRASQIFWFLNAESMPSEEEITTRYTHLYVNDELKKLRSEHRRRLKKLSKEKKDSLKKDQERLF